MFFTPIVAPQAVESRVGVSPRTRPQSAAGSVPIAPHKPHGAPRSRPAAHLVHSSLSATPSVSTHYDGSTTAQLIVPSRPMSSAPHRTRTATVGMNLQSFHQSPRVHTIVVNSTPKAANSQMQGAKQQQPPVQVPKVFVPVKEETSDHVPPPPVESGTSNSTSTIYHAMVSRKQAEEEARQLARRIAHYRAQEQRVLREVYEVKQRIENMLAAPQDDNGSDAQMKSKKAMQHQVKWNRGRIRCASAPKARDQLALISQQKKEIQAKKSEAARAQRQKLQRALEKQRQKQENDFRRKLEQKERIRAEEQRVLEERAMKQQKLRETLEEHQQQRLHKEKQRESIALSLIDEMREEERNLAIRLQALRVHQEYVTKNLKQAPGPVNVILNLAR